MMMATTTALTILQLFHFVRMYFTMLAAEQPYNWIGLSAVTLNTQN